MRARYRSLRRLIHAPRRVEKARRSREKCRRGDGRLRRAAYEANPLRMVRAARWHGVWGISMPRRTCRRRTAHEMLPRPPSHITFSLRRFSPSPPKARERLSKQAPLGCLFACLPPGAEEFAEKTEEDGTPQNHVMQAGVQRPYRYQSAAENVTMPDAHAALKRNRHRVTLQARYRKPPARPPAAATPSATVLPGAVRARSTPPIRETVGRSALQQPRGRQNTFREGSSLAPVCSHVLVRGSGAEVERRGC